MDHRERAVSLFMEGYSCAQAVFGAFCDVTGMDFAAAMRLSSSFGGGMGRMREVCGACSGMFMVLGMLFGHSEADPVKKAEIYARVQDVAERFRERNKTIICRELLEEIQTDTRPIPDARTAEYYKIRPCVRLVSDAAEILDKYLNESATSADD